MEDSTSNPAMVSKALPRSSLEPTHWMMPLESLRTMKTYLLLALVLCIHPRRATSVPSYAGAWTSLMLFHSPSIVSTTAVCEQGLSGIYFERGLPLSLPLDDTGPF